MLCRLLKFINSGLTAFSVMLFTLSCNEKPADRFVSIDGKSQHILELGSGEPVVVFVAGFGNDLSVYNRVQPEVSMITRTISYDRAGIGKSELSDSARTLERIVYLN